MPDHSPTLLALEKILKQASAMALEARESMSREMKKDGSIVTSVDKAVETYLRPVLQDLIPGSTVWGEEFGQEKESEAGLWLIDPIDGTSNFAFGGPIWAVSIAFIKGEDILYAAVSVPVLGEYYLAEKGKGAYLNGERLPPIPAGPVRPEELVSYQESFIRRWPNVKVPGKMRLSGAAVYEGVATATQRLRGMIGFREMLYDIAAVLLIGQELGAEIRYANGQPMPLTPLKDGKRIDHPWLMFPKDSDFVIPEA